MPACVSASGLSVAMTLYMNAHCLEGALHVLSLLCMLSKFRVLCCIWTFSDICQKETPSERPVEVMMLRRLVATGGDWWCGCWWCRLPFGPSSLPCFSVFPPCSLYLAYWCLLPGFSPLCSQSPSSGTLLPAVQRGTEASG